MSLTNSPQLIHPALPKIYHKYRLAFESSQSAKLGELADASEPDESYQRDLVSKATDWAINHVTADQCFTAADICQWHTQWLGEVYPWAGEYRQVNIGKGGFMFAMAAQVPRLMQEFERDVLARNTPCVFTNLDGVWRCWQSHIAS